MISTSNNLSIAYRAEVIRAGKVVASREGKNLIVDTGLAKMGEENNGFGFGQYRLIETARFGTSLNPVKRGSGAVTFTTTGSGSVTVTASAGFFVATDVNRILKLNTGEEIRITGYTSGTVVSGNFTGAITQGEAGAVHYVNDTNLGNPVPGTVPNATFGGYGLITFDPATGILTVTEAADSGAVTADTTITELGWFSYQPKNMVGRVLLPGVGLGVFVGDIVRVTLTANLTLNRDAIPVSAGAFSGTTRLRGARADNASNIANEVGRPSSFSLYDAPQDISSVIGTEPVWAGGAISGGNWSRDGSPALGVFDFKWEHSVSQGNGSIASIVWGRAWVHNLTVPFVKNSTMTMTLRVRVTFTRTLTN